MANLSHINRDSSWRKESQKQDTDVWYAQCSLQHGHTDVDGKGWCHVIQSHRQSVISLPLSYLYVGHCNLWNDQNHLGTRVLPMAEVTLIRINGLWFDFQPQLGHVSSTHYVLVPSYGKIWLEWDTGSLQISLIRSVEWPKKKHNTNYGLHQTAGDAPGSWLDLNFWFHYFAVAVFS